jgi:tetratricopeptide (TPR) repeat protein
MAYELCRNQPESPYLFQALFGLFHEQWSSGHVGEVQKKAGELMALTEARDDPERMLAATFAVGVGKLFSGRLDDALADFLRVREMYDPDTHKWLAFEYMIEFGVAYRFHLALGKMARGYPDQAATWAEDAVATARTRQPHNLCAALMFGGPIHILRGDPETALAWSEEGLEVSTRLGYAQSNAGCKVNRGWSLVRMGRPDEGISQIREGVEAHRAIEDATAQLRATGDQYFRCFVLSTKGDVLQSEPTPRTNEAEACYLDALDVARAQSAKSWELRAAIRLARLWHAEGRSADARALVEPVHGWFTEGFDTADLSEARLLLDRLA